MPPPASFLGITRNDRAADFVIAGVPLDIGTTNRAGARDGPHAIRRASRMLTDGAHPEFWIEPATMNLADIGDMQLALGDIQASLQLIEQQATGLGHLIALGGEHGITLPILRALSRRGRQARTGAFRRARGHLVRQFRPEPMHMARSSITRSRKRLVEPRNMIQIGIRSPMQREVWDWTVGHGVTVLTAQDVHAMGPDAVARRIREVVGAASTYLSFDIDALDPAFAPGTGTPEIGGLATWQAQAILRRLQGVAFAGMDVVEVAPAYDTAEITALAAATMVWEYLALLGAAG